MKTFEEFKKDYTEYMQLNNKQVDDKQVKKVYKDYKKHTEEYTEDDINLEKLYVRPEINVKISNILKEINEFREKKKQGEDVKVQLKEKLKELKELRLQKNK